MDVLARVEFTERMATVLYRLFDSYAFDGIVTLEAASNGLWLVNPNDGSRQFLGNAPFDDIQERPETT